MKLTNEAFQRILCRLASAYQAEDDISLRHGWEKRVMAHIQDLGPLTVRRNLAGLFDRYAWRLVPVACALFLLLGAVLYQQMDFISECQLAGLFLETGLDDTLFQMLGAS